METEYHYGCLAFCIDCLYPKINGKWIFYSPFVTKRLYYIFSEYKKD